MSAPPGRAWGGSGATDDIATFVAKTGYEDLPPEVVAAVKVVVLDTLAVSVAGAASPATVALADVLRDLGGASGDVTAIGLPQRLDAASAALVNGTTAHALDYDDYCFAMSGHPSVVLLPPLLALAERHGLGGRDVIRAYAVGFEAAVMVSHTVNPEHYGHGWHGTGTVGAVGAACAASSLLRLSVEQTTNAISIGASSAAGLRQNFGTDVKPLHAGNAARAAVMAAELAARGFVADGRILEGELGFFNAFTPGPHRFRSKPVHDFAHPWSTVDPGITTKLFPSCGSTHASLGGILRLRAAGLRAEDVAHIDVGLTDISDGNLRYPRPRTGLEGKFSLQYCVARALTAGKLGLDDFTDESVRDESLQDLIGRIDKHSDESLNAEYVWGQPRPAMLTVRLYNGETLVNRSDAAPGSPGHLSTEMLHDKVADCMGRGRVVGKPADAIEAVARLDECADIRELTALFAGRDG